MNKPLLSVIVPCYNVEKYIEKCILSIVSQTYTNLEIILIDDGSNDQTGILCDEQQAKDQRIRVIHQQNKGASVARKTGLELSQGEYLAFLDSDDWIDQNMFNDMMTALLSTNSDIAHCDLCFVFEDGSMKHRLQNREEYVKTMGRTEGVIMILEDHAWRTSFCTKIFKKKLFEYVQFPEGRIFGEDLIVHQLFHHAAQSVFLNKEFYFYYQRNDSVTRISNTKTELKKLADFSDAYFERYSFVNNFPEYHSTLPFVKHMALYAGFILLRNLIIVPQYSTKDEFYKKAKQMSSVSITKKDYLPKGLLIDLYILKINAKLYIFLRKLYIVTIKFTNKLKITNRQIDKLHSLW